jgi:hypothetical protein
MEERLQSEAESSAARHSAEATVLRGERNAAKKEAAEARKRVLSTNSEVHELRRRCKEVDKLVSDAQVSAAAATAEACAARDVLQKEVGQLRKQVRTNVLDGKHGRGEMSKLQSERDSAQADCGALGEELKVSKVCTVCPEMFALKCSPCSALNCLPSTVCPQLLSALNCLP